MSSQEMLLESGSVADIPKNRERFEQLVQFHWDYYCHLAFLRNKVYDALKNSVRDRATPFEIPKWQRAVKYRYSLDPLGTRGSLVDPGGRFNIGDIDTTRYPTFPALYLASDKGTALAELLGRDGLGGSLSAEELALTKPDSITTVSVSGKLESVFDAREERNFTGFINLIKGFRLPKTLTVKAKKLGLPRLPLVRTEKVMKRELQIPNWRQWPMVFEVPTSSQISGQIVKDAGIEGIVYTSVLTQKPCLTIYPQNFLNSSSFVKLDDPGPKEAFRTRIDAATFKDFI